MVIKKRQILWDWTNSTSPENQEKINQVPFNDNSPVASVVNWNAWVPPELNGRAPFRPMVRVLENTQGNDWSIIENTPYPIILFLNEPERAGISPELARDIWYNQMLPLRRDKGKQLGSPAVASDDRGREWIERFMSLVANDAPDYLCLHYYSTNGNEAISYIEGMHQKWPTPKVMVTEIASIHRNYNDVLGFTIQVCNWMDEQDWIFEYGLFDFQRTLADDFISPAAQLMDSNGNFTQLGWMYVNDQPMHWPGAVASAAAEGAGAGGVTEEASGNSTALDEGQQRALNLHNERRGSKGLQPLEWDNELAQNATTYAEHLASIGELVHPPGDQRPNQGENLAWGSGVDANPFEFGTNMWLDEEKNYHGEAIGEGDFGSYGHYTQCIWSGTTKVGLGWAKDANGAVYIVGRYSPPGNITGQKPY